MATLDSNHWANDWTTDEAAECLPYGSLDEPENEALYCALWNDVGPDKPLIDALKVLTAEQQAKLEAAYTKWLEE